MAAAALAASALPLPLPSSSEAELVARLAELAPSGVAVVEVFSEAWGPCKAVSACFKSLRAEHDDPAALSLLSVAAERVSSLIAPPKSAASSPGTAAAARSALAAIAARAGKSEPLFAVFRGGLLVESVRGADPPRLIAAVEGLLPAAPGTAGQHKGQQAGGGVGGVVGGGSAEDDDAGVGGGVGAADAPTTAAGNPFKALLTAGR